MASRGADAAALWDRPVRRMRIVKHLGHRPVEAICVYCCSTFTVPVSAMNGTCQAVDSLQVQFNRHECKREDPNKTPVKIERPAIEER